MNEPKRPEFVTETVPQMVRIMCLGLLSMGTIGCLYTHDVTSGLSGTQSVAIRGLVHGGQQPVSGSTIQLYSAGRAGNHSGAVPLLVQPVSTGNDGSFSITGDYTCPSPDSLVYVTSSGGNPGLALGTNNSSLVMLAVLGSCNTLSSSTNVFINERTTVAAAWALAPFMSGASDIASSATNYSVGLTNAFLNTQLLVNSSTGEISTAASNLTVESGKLNALADAIAPCVNSDGQSACSPLFEAATVGSSVPGNTLNAVLNIVKNPGSNVALVFDCIAANPPFATTLSRPPNDWTMSITVTGGGIQSPTSLGVDAYGNVWVANYAGSVSAFSPQGLPFSATGYGAAALSETYGLIVDNDNNIWATSEESPAHGSAKGSITKLFGTNAGSAMGSIAIPADYETFTNYPEALAADSNGDIAVANFAGGTGSIFDSTGNVVASGLGSGFASGPSAIAFDSSHGIWIANNDSTVTHIDSLGNIIARPTCCARAQGIAVDASQSVWITDYLTSSITELASDGSLRLTGLTGGGIDYPGGLAIDAGQNIWIANYHGNSFSQLSGNTGSITPGTPMSPSTGFGIDAVVPSGNGVISSLLLPYAIQPDPSGNIWVSAFASNDLVMFLGLAAPSKTPFTVTPVAP